MKPISTKTLRDADWRHVYAYKGRTLLFNVFVCDALPGLAITHSRKLTPGIKHATSRVNTIYSINGTHRTSSPSQAVRYYNEQNRPQAAGPGRAAARSLKPVG